MNEPITIHKRKPLTAKERVELFRAHDGMCCLCGGKIQVGEAWIDEHQRALAMGGTNDLSNRGPAHVKCAKVKTKDDMGQIAKAKRREAKHMGATQKKPWPSRKFNTPRYDNTKYINEDV